ncbi:hypothetical protein ACWEFJ_37705 [Actinosynnema sp. NPDC004786]
MKLSSAAAVPTQSFASWATSDPFATYLPDGGERDGVPETGTWLVNLADLIMAADVLRDPAEFYAYAELRARINKIGGPRIFVETDALGAWCEHRTSSRSASLQAN